MSDKWNAGELKDLEKSRDELLLNLVQSLVKNPKTIFAAKFEFGSPPIDIIDVTDDRSKRAYSVKLPLVNGELSTSPYYQGFGEAIFFLDQMIDQTYLMIPDIEIKEFVHFIPGVNPIKRWKKMTTGVGLVTFDKSYNLKTLKEPSYPTTKRYIRLEIELADILLKYGEIEIRKGKEASFDDYKKWVKKELEEIGDKRIMPEKYARIISEKVLRNEGVYSPTFELKEDEIKSRPYPLPTFVVEGEGNHLGNQERFRLVINRITGNIIDKRFN